MTENNNPVAEEPTEGSSEVSNSKADSFFNEEAAPVTKSSRNFWAKPAVAIAGAAIASGLLGFAIGNGSSDHMRPAAITGEAFIGQPGQGQHGDGMPGFGGSGRHGHDRNGAPGQGFGEPGQMGPGATQNGTDFPPTIPHCHDATGADLAPEANGLCADGSQPGARGMGGQPAAPAPSASTSTSVQ